MPKTWRKEGRVDRARKGWLETLARTVETEDPVAGAGHACRQGEVRKLFQVRHRGEVPETRGPLPTINSDTNCYMTSGKDLLLHFLQVWGMNSGASTTDIHP